jgi:hypothetical protein
MHPEPITSAPVRRQNPQPLAAAADPDALLNMRTASALSGLSESSLYRHAAAARLVLVRVGARCTRVRAGELRRFLASLG